MGRRGYRLLLAIGFAPTWASAGDAAQSRPARAAVAYPVTAAVASLPGRLIKTTEPLIDVTKNPGCGVTGLSPAQKVERNRRLALYYFQASVETARRDYKYTLASQGCVPDDGKSMWLYGAFTPPPAEPTMVDVGKGNEGQFIQNESRAWRSVFPDFGAVPGTLRVIPYEDGVFFTFMYAGTSKTGEKVEFWEVVNQLVNENGKIYHYECWNDTAGMERAFQIAFNTSFRGMTLEKYFELIKGKLAAAGIAEKK